MSCEKIQLFFIDDFTNNTTCATKLFDCARRHRLPSVPELLPDQSKPFTGADGSVCKVSQTKVLQAATGDDGVSYLVSEEGTLGEVKDDSASIPFKMSPQATLPYVNILFQVGMYRGMSQWTDTKRTAMKVTVRSRGSTTRVTRAWTQY